MFFDVCLGDLRLAVRHAIRRPGFASLVVGTLALGIGAATAALALTDAVLVRPLPYRDSERLVFIWTTLPSQRVFEAEASPFDYAAWQQARSLSSVALIASETVTLTGNGEAERLHGARVSASLLPLLGIAPARGRGFARAEDGESAAPTVVLSAGLWQRRYGGDPGVVGRSIAIGGVAHTVVGVMPPDAWLLGPLAGSGDVWLPLRFSAAERANEISHNYTVVGRLAPGASVPSAAAELRAIASEVARSHPDTHKNLGVRVVTLAEQTSGSIRPALLLLLAGVVLLAAIACANAATLLLARASDRLPELAVRTAVGASRLRLLSLALTESTALTAVASGAGLVLGAWLLRALMPEFSGILPPSAHVTVGVRIAASVGAGAIALAVALGAVVCAHQSSTPAAELLQSAARAIGSARITRSRSTLVALQIALAVLLLAGAGLMAKSFARLQHVRPGFDPDGLLTFRLAVPEPRYAGRERAAFVDDLVTRLNAIAGVRSAAVNTRLPFGGARGANGVAIDGRPAAAGETIAVDQREVTPAYFQTMRIPVLSGRAFSDRDDGSSEAVAIVNRTMAARYWRDGRAVDHLVRVAAGEEASGWLRIVGVVDDVRHTSLAKAPVAELYRPFAQMPLADFSVVLRTAGDPSLAAPSARATVASLDRNLAVYDVRPMDARIAASFAQTRATARLLLAAALMAALLAAVAIFGAIWYAVTERQAEIGVRMALGATPATVWRLVVGGAVAVAGWGMGVGLAAAFALTPLMQSMLFDVRANDPATYAAVGAGILLLTLAASAAPARRAMRIDALTAIRRD